MGPSAIWISTVVCFISFILVGLSFSFLMVTPDRYIVLTMTKPFTDWPTLSSLIRDTESYNPVNNSRFITEVSFANKNGTGKAVLLQKLLDTASCTAPTSVVSGVIPANRTMGCQCITGVYLGFLNATLNNSVNISRDVRDKYANEITGCLRFRTVWQSYGCGDKCWIHPIWVAFYSNGVLFLLTWGFMINYLHEIFGRFWVSPVKFFRVIMCVTDT